MQRITVILVLPMVSLFSFLLTSCASVTSNEDYYIPESVNISPPPVEATPNYAARLPQRIDTKERTVLVNPNVHAWGAYDENGNLERAGVATSGGDYCPDLHRPCHTHPGVFHVNSLGNVHCKSSMFPIGKGGAPMPYCMFFNKNQALHGVPDHEVGEANVSHGCVRLRVSDAEWLRFNFIKVGTKVVVLPY